MLLFRRYLESLYFEEFVVNVGIFFVKMFLIWKWIWKKIAWKFQKCSCNLLKTTFLILSFQGKQVFWTLYNPNCTHLTTDRTFSYRSAEVHKWLKSLLASHWSLDDLENRKEGRDKHISEQNFPTEWWLNQISEHLQKFIWHLFRKKEKKK